MQCGSYCAQGEYFAKLLRQGIKPGLELPEGAEPFRYGHKGSLAYVGSDRAVMDMPGVGPIKAPPPPIPLFLFSAPHLRPHHTD